MCDSNGHSTFSFWLGNRQILLRHVTHVIQEICSLISTSTRFLSTSWLQPSDIKTAIITILSLFAELTQYLIVKWTRVPQMSASFLEQLQLFYHFLGNLCNIWLTNEQKYLKHPFPSPSIPQGDIAVIVTSDKWTNNAGKGKGTVSITTIS